jgi:hypothetical protein
MAKTKPNTKTAAKPAAKAAKPAPAAKPAKAGKAKIDRGEGSYAVQAKKMKALIDTLREAEGAIEESKVIKELSRRGFPVHPRTLLREVDRIRILGHAVERVVGEGGTTYALVADPKIAEAFAALEAARKELRKAGSPLEKSIASAVKVLKG